MRHIILSLAILLAVPASAQTADTAAALQASALHNGQVVYSADGKRIGTLNRIDAGTGGAIASVKVIAGDRMVTLPGNTLSLKDANVVTSLTKSDINKIR